MNNYQEFAGGWKTLLVAGILGASVFSAQAAEASTQQSVRYKRTLNHVISGENVKSITQDISFAECATACSINDWCASFDYAGNACYLSDKNAHSVGAGFIAVEGYSYFEKLDPDPIRPFLSAPGSAIVGNNIATLSTWSQDVCAEACLENEECRSFDVGGGMCYLSDKVPSDEGIEVAESSSFDLYWATDLSIVLVEDEPLELFERTAGTAIADNNIHSFASRSPVRCANACLASETCRSFDYGDDMCYLSDKAPGDEGVQLTGNSDYELYTLTDAVASNNSYTYAVSRETLLSTYERFNGVQPTVSNYEFYQLPNRVISGENIESIFDSTIENCLFACQNNDQCLSVDYHPETHECYLNSESAGTKATTHSDYGYNYFGKATAGPVRSIQYFPNFRGAGGVVDSLEGTVAECSEVCVADSDCQSFDYDRRTHSCYLRSGTPGREGLTPAIAGRWDHYAVSQRKVTVHMPAPHGWTTRILSWRHLLASAPQSQTPTLSLINGPTPGISLEIDGKLMLIQDGAAIAYVLHSQGVSMDEANLDAILTEGQLAQLEAEFAVGPDGLDAAIEAKLAEGNVTLPISGVDTTFEGGVGSGSSEFEIGNDGLVAEAAGCAAEGAASVEDVDTQTDVSSGCVGGTLVATEDGVAIGGGVTAVAISQTVGNPDRTNMLFGVGAGIGAAAEARWGRDGQYGLAFDFKFVSFGIMIHEDDLNSFFDNVAGAGVSFGEELAAQTNFIGGILSQGTTETLLFAATEVIPALTDAWQDIQDAWDAVSDAFDTISSWF